jgi:DNA-binding CsgD family transcriptional regulator
MSHDAARKAWVPLQEEGAPVSGHITQRQAQVLDLVSQGKTCAEAAKALHISRCTAATHLKHVYTTLGVQCAAHAVRRGFELGTLKTDVHAELDAVRAELGRAYKALVAANAELAKRPAEHRTVSSHPFGDYLLGLRQVA